MDKIDFETGARCVKLANRKAGFLSSLPLFALRTQRVGSTAQESWLINN